MKEESYDVAIIGGGPAGLTAAIYLGRAKLNSIVLEKAVPGGNAAITDMIENYPGFPDGISGRELSERMRAQAEKFGTKFKILHEVISVDLKGDIKKIKTSNEEINASALIIATGTEWAKLNVPGEEKLTGKGVSYCATCDGPFFKDRTIAVIGGGDSAVDEANYLTRFGKKVIIIHRRDRLRAAKIIQDRAFANPKIDFRFSTIVTEIIGDEFVKALRLRNLNTEEEEILEVEGVFVFVGNYPSTSFLKGQIEMDEAGYIITNERMEASVKGVFACGDVRKKMLKQVVTACGEGATAAVAAQHYIEELKGEEYK